MNWAIKNPPKTDTFFLPNEEHIATVSSDDYVKLIFVDEHNNAERMWVKVISINEKYWQGTLENKAVTLTIKHGALVIFKPEQIIDVLKKDIFK